MSDAGDVRFHGEMAAIVHARLTDPDCDELSRERVAASVRKIADIAKRGDPTFSYEWFYGAYGLDPWGDLQPPIETNAASGVKWDPELGDFRRL